GCVQYTCGKCCITGTMNRIVLCDERIVQFSSDHYILANRPGCKYGELNRSREVRRKVHQPASCHIRNIDDTIAYRVIRGIPGSCIVGKEFNLLVARYVKVFALLT